MDKTKIEWADATVSPIRARDKETGKVGWFCEHATPGCEYCYSEAFNHRLGTGIDYKRQYRDRIELFLDDRLLLQPIRWRRSRRIFWNSMTDTFGDFVPDEFIDRQFAACTLTPQHTHLFLTKRSRRVRQWFAEPDRADRVGLAMLAIVGRLPYGHRCVPWPLPNVWLGVSVEDQARADERRDDLRELAEQGWRTFVSYEPALGPVNWRGWEFLSWLISGGESGPKARPSHPDWHRAARDFCAEHGIAYHFKQWGAWTPIPTRDDLPGRPQMVRQGDCFVARDGRAAHVLDGCLSSPLEGMGEPMHRVGKARAGRLLDGREHNGVPA